MCILNPFLCGYWYSHAHEIPDIFNPELLQTLALFINYQPSDSPLLGHWDASQREVLTLVASLLKLGILSIQAWLATLAPSSLSFCQLTLSCRSQRAIDISANLGHLGNYLTFLCADIILVRFFPSNRLKLTDSTVIYTDTTELVLNF